MSPRQQAAPGESPAPQAAPGESPAPDNEMSSLVSEEVREQAELAAQPGPPPELEEPEPQVPEEPHHEPPIQNQLGEMKRLIEKQFNEINDLKVRLSNYQQPQQTVVQPQRTPIIQKKDIGKTVWEEIQGKIQAGEFSWERPDEIMIYQTNRSMEIMSEQNQSQGRIAAERQQSESRAIEKAKSMGYSLQNSADPMTLNVRQEIERRANTLGMSAKEYYEAFPFAFEDAVNSVSGRLSPQTQQGREIRQPANPPVSDILTARRKPVEKEPVPTEVDNVYSRRYGSNFKTVTEVEKLVRNPKTYEVVVPIDLD